MWLTEPKTGKPFKAEPQSNYMNRRIFISVFCQINGKTTLLFHCVSGYIEMIWHLDSLVAETKVMRDKVNGLSKTLASNAVF